MKFIMKLQGASVAKVNAAATVEDAASGSVSYPWLAADTDVAGTYEAEFEVTFAGGEKRTFPADSYFYVTVIPDLA